MNMKRIVLIILFFSTGIIWATQQIRISCIGNSITAGEYPQKLSNLLGTTYKVENEGVGSTTVLKNGNFPYWTRGKFEQVFDFQPDIVTIKLGTNDTKSQNWDSFCHLFKRDYLAFIDTLNTLESKPRIWIVLPVPIFSMSYGIRDSALQKILPILKEIGQERNIPIIDANTPLKNFSQYFSDGVHPNAAGADTIAHVIYRALTRTSVKKAMLSAIQSSSSDIVKTHKVFSLFVPSQGVTTARLFDLRGCIIHTQTFRIPGLHLLDENNRFHGVFLVQIKNEGQAAFCRKIIMQ